MILWFWYSSKKLSVLPSITIFDPSTFLPTITFTCSTLIDLNDGGKILLSERFKPIPLSVWPVVLERVNQRKGYYDNTNVLYHLLRNGPAMGKRCQMARRSSIPPFHITRTMGADDAIGTGTGNAVFTSRLPHPSQFSPSCAVGTARPTVMTTTKKRKISMP